MSYGFPTQGITGTVEMLFAGDARTRVAARSAGRQIAQGGGGGGIAKSAVSKARSRLKWQLFEQLLRRCAKPLASLKRAEDTHAFYAGLRLVAIDGSNFELADEVANDLAFGRPGSRTGRAAYPQAQCAVLTECGTHAILDAALGAYGAAEWKIASTLLRTLDDSMLCLADRGFVGYQHWQAARATGAHLLWRMPKNLILPIQERLPDGSYLSALYPSQAARRTKHGGITVRVIEYTLPGVPDAEPMLRLVTSLLDYRRAPALVLARLYHESWEVEAVFDELKTHLGQARRTLRSKIPELVRQEFFGWVMAHYAVRWLMYCAATEHRTIVRDLSFVENLQIMRRTQPLSGAFPPSKTAQT